MCGRYSLAEPGKIAERFDAEPASGPLSASWNVAPGQSLPVITRNSPNKVEVMRWGLIPSWAKDPKIGYKMINARGETVAEKNSFRSAFKSRRCLVPATGYYEWKREGLEKLPYFFRLKSADLFSFAGLYEHWHNAEGNLLSTYTVITTEPNRVAERVHDRMPVILPREAEETWLSQDSTADQLMGLLVPYPEEDMDAYQVSQQVNSPVNNGEALVAPLNSL